MKRTAIALLTTLAFATPALAATTSVDTQTTTPMVKTDTTTSVQKDDGKTTEKKVEVESKSATKAN